MLVAQAMGVPLKYLDARKEVANAHASHDEVTIHFQARYTSRYTGRPEAHCRRPGELKGCGIAGYASVVGSRVA